MRYLIKIAKCFYWASLILLCLSVYAFLTQDFLWFIFIIAAGSMAYFSKLEYTTMEEDIRQCKESLVYDIKQFCEETDERGIHTLELTYGDYLFKIKLHYTFDIREEIGATHMGDCETIRSKDKEYIGILKMECFNTFGEPYDHGFTEYDLQDKI